MANILECSHLLFFYVSIQTEMPRGCQQFILKISTVTVGMFDKINKFNNIILRRTSNVKNA